MKSKMFAMLALVAQAANAQSQPDVCSRYVGTTVNPLSFEQATAPLSKLSAKDEYETTAQYEARTQEALSKLSSPVVIRKDLRESSGLTYDADSALLKVSAYIFTNTPLDPWTVFYYAKVNETKANTKSGNLTVVIAQSTKPAGSYIGSNAFGARSKVQRSSVVTSAIFDRKDRAYRDSLFKGDTQDTLGSIPMPPDEAKALQRTYKTAVVVTPKAPYFAQARYLSFEPTVETPEEERSDTSILIATVECGLVMNSKNHVLQAFQSTTAGLP